MTQCCDDKTSIIISFVIGFYLVGGFVNKLLKEPLEPSNIIIDAFKFLAWNTFLLIALSYFSAETFLAIFKVVTLSILNFVKNALYHGYIAPQGFRFPQQPAGNRLGGARRARRARRENQEPQEPQNTNNDMDELRRKPKKPKGESKFNFGDDESGPYITEQEDKFGGIYPLGGGSISQFVGVRENIEVTTEQQRQQIENNNNNNIEPVIEIPVTFSRPYSQSYGAALDRGESQTFRLAPPQAQETLETDEFKPLDFDIDFGEISEEEEEEETFTLETREIQGRFGINTEPISFPFPDITEYSIDNDNLINNIEELFLDIWNKTFNKYINTGRFHQGIIFFENNEDGIVDTIIEKLLNTHKNINDIIDKIDKYIRACILQGRKIYEASIDIIQQYTENIEINFAQFEEELLVREWEYRQKLLEMAKIYVLLQTQNIPPEDVSYDMINDFLYKYNNIQENDAAVLLQQKFEKIKRLLKFHDLYNELIKQNEKNTTGNILNQTVRLVKKWLDLGKSMRESSKKKERN